MATPFKLTGHDLVPYTRKRSTIDRPRWDTYRSAGLAVAQLAGAAAASKAYDYFSGKNNVVKEYKMPARFTRRPMPKRVYNKKTGKTYCKVPCKKSSKSKTSLSKQVKDLKRSVNADQARHVYKYFTSGYAVSANGACDHTALIINDAPTLETYTSQLRYYDPSNPATLVTAAGGTGTFSRQLHFKNIYSKLTVRANYLMPVRVKIYLVTPKGDTNIHPLTYYANGLVDQVIGGSAVPETAGIYLTDIDVFNKQWSAKLVKDVEIKPGGTVTATTSIKPFDYDPSVYDSHTVAYQPKFKSAVWVIRQEGVLAHDSTLFTQQGLMNSYIDYEVYHKAEILYDAGTNLNDIYLDDNRATTFTNGPMATNCPVADNQVSANN